MARVQKWGLAKDLERLLIYDLSIKGATQAEISKETGLAVRTVQRDLGILRDDFRSERKADFNLEFNKSMLRIESVVKDLFRDITDGLKGKEKLETLDRILDFMRERHRICGFYTMASIGEDNSDNFNFLVINGLTIGGNGGNGSGDVPKDIGNGTGEPGNGSGTTGDSVIDIEVAELTDN